MRIQEYQTVLTQEECIELIERGSSELKTASTMTGISDFRIAQMCWLYENTPTLQKIKEFVEKETGYPISHQEAPHLVKYDVGGQYKPHWDYFIPGESYYEQHTKVRGQRTHTVLFYLNDDFEGGSTKFTRKNVEIIPKEGKAVLWENYKDGEIITDSMHWGMPVEEGTKWILVIWVRER